MVHNNMCMKNINAIANIDALDENGKVVTIIDEITMEKKISSFCVKKILVSFNASIINGTEKFFSTYHKLYFQLRITDKNGNSNPSFVLKEYRFDMEDNNLHHNTDLVDFIYKSDMFISNFDINEIDRNKKYYLNVLVKTEDDIRSNKGWTIQSVTPLIFN